MDLHDLVSAILAGDLLTARQWVADARRSNLQWDRLEQPCGLTGVESTVAAAMVELIAARNGVVPPRWTENFGAVPTALILDPGLEQMPRSLAVARTNAPAPLRKRNLVALPDFLDIA